MCYSRSRAGRSRSEESRIEEWDFSPLTRGRRNNSSARSVKVTWAEAARDVLTISMNRGQFPLAILAILFGLFLWKLPDEKVYELAKELLAGLLSGYLIGYGLFALSVLAWFVHSKSQRRSLARELARVSAERSDLQKKLLGNKNVRSSQ